MTCAAPVVRCRIVEIVRTVHRNFCHPSTSRRDKGAADQRAPGVAWTSSRASPAAAGETDGGSGASPSEMTEDSLRFDVRTAPSCHAVVDPDAPYWDWCAIEVALRVPARGQRRGSRFKRACHRGTGQTGEMGYVAFPRERVYSVASRQPDPPTSQLPAPACNFASFATLWRSPTRAHCRVPSVCSTSHKPPSPLPSASPLGDGAGHSAAPSFRPGRQAHRGRVDLL